jgi:chitinase
MHDMKRIKHLRLWIQFTCLIAILSGCSKNEVKASGPEPVQDTKKSFVVIGYLFAGADLMNAAAKVDLNKLTHLNIAFINPDATGAFAPVSGLQELVKKAHDNKVKVIAAFAGGNPPGYLKDLLRPEKRKLLVDGLLQLTQTYNLDGIDVDLEGDFVNENYEEFIIALSAGLKKQNKLMTAAVATWNSAAYSDKALALFDLISIMSYDHTGPWRKEQPGPHASYEDMELDFSHWNTGRSIPVEKLVLGLPFYAYGFGPDISESMNYGDLIAAYPGADKVDVWELPGKGTFYYNGMPTIKKKVAYAVDKKAAGLMIWQVLGDAPGSLSLLDAIYKGIQY